MNIWKLWFDGSCQPCNPGGHGCGGWVIRDGMHGFKVADGAEWFGSGAGMTNNVAEHRALLLALEWVVRQPGPVGLHIMGDSLLVVNQVSGKWRGRKTHLLELRDRCLRLLSAVESAGGRWMISWVPRAENAEADALSTSLQAGLPELTMTDAQRRRAWVMRCVTGQREQRKAEAAGRRQDRRRNVKRCGMCVKCGQRAKQGADRCRPCAAGRLPASAFARRHPELVKLFAAVLDQEAG